MVQHRRRCRCRCRSCCRRCLMLLRRLGSEGLHCCTTAGAAAGAAASKRLLRKRKLRKTAAAVSCATSECGGAGCCSLEPARTLHAASPREGVARSDPPASAAPSALAAFATISGGRPRETEEPVTRPEIAGMFFEWTGNHVNYFWRFLGLFWVYLRRR